MGAGRARGERLCRANRQRRLSVSPLPLPIPAGVLDLTPIDPGFTADFDSTLGNAATPTDGFDSMILHVVNAIADLPALQDSLDSHLLDLGSCSGEVHTHWSQDF